MRLGTDGARIVTVARRSKLSSARDEADGMKVAKRLHATAMNRDPGGHSGQRFGNLFVLFHCVLNYKLYICDILDSM